MIYKSKDALLLYSTS